MWPKLNCIFINQPTNLSSTTSSSTQSRIYHCCLFTKKIVFARKGCMYHRSSSVLWVRFPSDLLCDIPLLLGHLTNYSQTAVKFHLCLSQWQWLLIVKCKKFRTKAIGSTVTAYLESYTFPFTFRRVDQYMYMCADNLHRSKCSCTNILRDLLTHHDVAILSKVSWNHIKEFNLLTHTYIIITWNPCLLICPHHVTICVHLFSLQLYCRCITSALGAE